MNVRLELQAQEDRDDIADSMSLERGLEFLWEMDRRIDQLEAFPESY